MAQEMSNYICKYIIERQLHLCANCFKRLWNSCC